MIGVMENLINDVRFGLRTFRKQTLFSAVAIITLALGIGATTAIFSVVHAVLLKPLPFYRPDRIVLFWGDNRAQGNRRGQVSYTDMTDYRKQQTVFENIATFARWNPTLTGTGEAEKVGSAL
jgi:putative ABC transport system permease protein